MTLQQQFRRATLLATSYRGAMPEEMFHGPADLLILGLAAQERCCSIIKSSSSECRQSLILGIAEEFVNCDPETAQSLANWQDRLRKFPVSDNPTESLSLLPSSRDSTFKKLLSHAESLSMQLCRPIDISLDLTCCPLYHALGLIAVAVKKGLARRITVFYAEGKYPPAGLSEQPHEIFTSGEWQVAAVPGLSNPWTPGGTRLYVVAVGFEGNKTLRLCERREPDRVIIVFPEPGVFPEYPARTRHQNEALFERFGILDSALIRVNAGDTVGVWKALSRAQGFQETIPDVEYLCCGTKPHGLGMALQVLSNGNGVLCDIIAEERLHTDVKEAGSYWRYDIENLAAL